MKYVKCIINYCVKCNKVHDISQTFVEADVFKGNFVSEMFDAC